MRWKRTRETAARRSRHSAIRRAETALALLLALPGLTRGASMKRISEKGEAGKATVIGVKAGAFQPEAWRESRLHWVMDERWPTIPPAEGKLRNIYAPMAIPEGRGYRVYFGGWDGSDDGHDRLYTLTTDAGFLKFSTHTLIVDKGPFIHVNNDSVVKLPDGTVYLMATTYPDAQDANKPALFVSKDGLRFNGSLPYVASKADWASITGYTNFVKADINGMNVLLRDGDKWRLYFCDFKNWGKVYRATSDDARHFAFDGVAVDVGMMVNDVKLLPAEGKTYALMALHQNGDRLSYSLSTDTAKFPAPQTLFLSAGSEDRYIVAAGWVTEGSRLLGILYGAGANPDLAHNRLFARWLQKRVRFETEIGDLAVEGRAVGPDRFVFSLPEGKEAKGRFVIETETGEPLYQGPEVTLKPGEEWRVKD